MIMLWLRRGLLALAIGAALILALPSIFRLVFLQQGLPFGLQERLGVAAEVRGLSWHHLDLAQVTWGPTEDSAIEAGAVTVDYTPTALKDNTVDTINVSGLVIHLISDPDGISLRGMAKNKQNSTSTSPNSVSLGLPLAFQKLDIRQSRILIHTPNTVIDIPFQLHLEPDKDQPNLLLFASEILAGKPTPSIHGKIALAARTAQAEYSFPLAALARFWPELVLPGALLSGNLDITMSDEGKWTLTSNGTLSDNTNTGTITAALPNGEISFSPVHFQCQGTGSGSSGALSLSAGVDTLDTGPASLRHLSASLPWTWPTPSKSQALGKLDVDTITLRGKKIGALGITVQQTGQASAKLAGTFRGEKVFPLHGELKGTAGIDPKSQLPHFDFTLEVPPLDLKSLDLQAVLELFTVKPTDRSPIALTGTLTAKFTAQGNALHQEAKGTLNLADSSLSLAKNRIELNGVSGEITLPDLLSAKDVPRATFRFAKATVADHILSDGELKLHRDGETSLFIERVKAGWSGGEIHALGLRISQGSRDLGGDLYCDRLNLAQLLSQLGIPKVSGSGTISGRLPIQYANGKIQIAQGFLYSPPGGGGSIRLKSGDLITGGVPAGTPQFGQLTFAAAALEDFSYNWLSMGLESKGEEMTITMSLDGHPAKPLPFRYDTRLGTFTKVTGSGEIGVNQPVRLDVNFHLPLNEFLGYGKSIKTLRDQLR